VVWRSGGWWSVIEWDGGREKEADEDGWVVVVMVVVVRRPGLPPSVLLALDCFSPLHGSASVGSLRAFSIC